jgi:hypothetical protein
MDSSTQDKEFGSLQITTAPVPVTLPQFHTQLGMKNMPLNKALDTVVIFHTLTFFGCK